MQRVWAVLVPSLLSQAAGVRTQRPEAPSITESGCKCKSHCYNVEEDGFNCDRCDTSGCGKWGPVNSSGTSGPVTSRRYDFCTYPVQESFEAQTYQQKIDFYWNKVTEDPRSETFEPGALVLKQSTQTTFDNWLPEMPAGRKKSIHMVGSVCKIEFKVESTKYTGILGAGSHQGFIRMGSASHATLDSGLTPGIGLKFPRSGVHAADWVSMHSTASGQSYNFFASNMTNHVTTAGSVISQKFQQATICGTFVGLSDVAKFSQTGQEFTPRFPYKLFYIPTEEVQMGAHPKTGEDLGDEFAQIPAGTPMFRVYGCDSAGDHEDESPVSFGRHCVDPTLLGTIKTTSKCTTSNYGDNKFFFRHQRIEEDWALKPEYREKSRAACGRTEEDWKGESPPKCASGMLASNA